MKLKGFKKSDGSIAKIYTDPTLTESDSPADAASVKAKDDLLQQGITNNANYAAGLNTRLSELENGAPSIIAPKVTEWLDANVDPTGSAVTVDSSLTIAGSAADAKKTGDELTDLKSDLHEVQRTLYSDLLKGKDITERWYIDPSTGTGSVNSIFFSIQNVEIPSGIEHLYPYSNNRNNTYYIRSVSFYDSNETFISGVSGNASTVENGIPVPNSATKVSVSISNNSTEYYLSTTKDNVPYYDEKIDLLNSSVDLIETQIEEVSDIVTVTHTDILQGKEVTPSWFIAPATGEGSTNSAFFSIQNVEIPSNVKRIYPYSNNGNDTYYIRSVVFFDANGTYISGVSGNASTVEIGIPVPNSATKVSVSISNNSTEYYLSTDISGDVEKKFLNEEISVSIDQVTNLRKQLEASSIVPVQLENRKPTFTFIFDDGTDGDVNTKALFDSYGFKCGFALIGSETTIAPSKERYLPYQNDGFEILSHSVNGTAFNTVTDLATAESYLKDSLSVLKNAGFDVKGWVTPSTWLLAEQLPLVEKYYQYGFGHLTGAPTGIAYHQFIGLDIRQLDRWNLQNNTVEATLAKIDETITNNAYMIFYGHSYPSTSNNMTEENMNTILTYLKTKADNGEIMVDTPRKTINNYYSFRHSDLLNLVNT